MLGRYGKRREVACLSVYYSLTVSMFKFTMGKSKKEREKTLKKEKNKKFF